MIHSLLVASLKKTSCVFFVFFSAAGRQWTSPCLPTATFSTWATWSAAFRRRACTEWWAQVRRDLAFDLSLLAAAWVVVVCCWLCCHAAFRGEPPQPGPVRGVQPPRVGDGGGVPGGGEAAPALQPVLCASSPLQTLAPHVRSSFSGVVQAGRCALLLFVQVCGYFLNWFLFYFFYFFMFVAESFPGCAAFLFFLQSSGFCYHHLVWWALWITLHDINMPYARHTQRQHMNMLRIQVAGLWMQFDFIWVLMWFIYLLNYKILKIQNTKVKKKTRK